MGSVRVAIDRFITFTAAVAAISTGIVVVGVVPAAGAPPPTPMLTTVVSEPNGLVDDQISDTVTLVGTDGAPATLACGTCTAQLSQAATAPVPPLTGPGQRTECRAACR